MQRRFNRYIVECKFGMCRLINLFAFDLIDTQWNVNVAKDGKTKTAISDLIDTQWNVNTKTYIACQVFLRI